MKSTESASNKFRSAFRFSMAALVITSAICVSLYLQMQKSESQLAENKRHMDILSLQLSDCSSTTDSVQELMIRLFDKSNMRIPLLSTGNSNDNVPTLIWNSGKGDLYLYQDEITKTSSGQALQLWAMKGGVGKYAGTLNAKEEVQRMTNCIEAELFMICTGDQQNPKIENALWIGKVSPQP